MHAAPPRDAAALQVQSPQGPSAGVPSPPAVSINPRRAAAFGAAIVFGLLLLQYAHRRQPFILLWASGWLLIIPALLLVARGYDSVRVARAAVGLSQFLAVCAALLYFWSGDVYRQTGYVRAKHLKALAAGAAYFVLAPLVFGIGAVLVPGYIVSATMLAAAGAMYAAILIERRMIGAGLIAFVLLGLAVSNLTSAVLVRRLLGSGDFTFEILMVNVVLYACGAMGIHLLIFEDMTYELRLTNRRLESAREELTQAAITDPLTGCHNRRFLDQVIDRELQRHARFELPLSLLFIDIDKFKAVNDSLGHDAGDRVLQYFARFLKRHIREADYVFRWGGDEFLVLITCSGDEAGRKAAALKSEFDAAPDAVELPPGIGLSVGWTEVPQGTLDLTPLVAEADARMYQDKHRNPVESRVNTRGRRPRFTRDSSER
ncbi:MAG TPA: GGDEF domain-containing protein [Vicinamibacterales bacterium]|jgi:diguanylate cyclase (GGDEF)-like protein|nr:GGDEF domain-containing protein [Vicinamibacterales bacterium]